jgi:hypothetical protein
MGIAKPMDSKSASLDSQPLRLPIPVLNQLSLNIAELDFRCRLCDQRAITLTNEQSNSKKLKFTLLQNANLG